MISSARPLPAVRVTHSTADKCILKGVPGLGPVVHLLNCGGTKRSGSGLALPGEAGSKRSGWEDGACGGRVLPREGGWLD